MYIETVPNRTSPPAILLREGCRQYGKVVKRTLANLSHWDPQLVEHFRVLLKGGVAVESAASVLSIERSLPHGHVAAVLGAARGSGSALWFGSAPKELQPLLQAMLVARVLEPASKLATHRMLHDDTATTSLGRVLDPGQCSVDELYRALDWLHEAQPAIERRLARQHLVGSTLVLYDLTSTWLTGRCCELAARGHSRDGKRDDPQIVFGLVCTAEGCPIAVEVFKGNTADPATAAAQVAKLKERFGIHTIAWVGDGGMLTSARIEQVLQPQGMDWVSSLRAPQIAQLAAEQGPFQPSLFDERNLIELSSEQFSGERLVVCRNPWLAQERARKRQEPLAATEAELAKIAAATQRARRPLRGQQAIAQRVGRVIERFHMAKHLALTITDDSLNTATGARIPVRLRPRPTSQLRTRLAFRPCDRATAATDAPGSLQAASTLTLSSAPWRRRGTGLECIGVHQSNRWTPSSARAQGQTRWDGWTLTQALFKRTDTRTG